MRVTGVNSQMRTALSKCRRGACAMRGPEYGNKCSPGRDNEGGGRIKWKGVSRRVGSGESERMKIRV